MKNTDSPNDRFLSLQEILALKDVVFKYKVNGNPHYQYTTAYDTAVMGYPSQHVSYCPVAELGHDLMLAPWRWLTKSDSESKTVTLTYVYDDGNPSKGCYAVIREPAEGGPLFDVSGKAWNFWAHTMHLKIDEFGDVLSPRPVMAYRTSTQKWVLCRNVGYAPEKNLPFVMESADGTRWYSAYFREIGTCLPASGVVSDNGTNWSNATITDYSPNSPSPFATNVLRWKYARIEIDDDVIDRKAPKDMDLPRKVYVRADENSIWVTRNLVESVEGRYVTSDGKIWPHMAEMDSNPFPRMMRVFRDDGKVYEERIVVRYDTDKNAYVTFTGLHFRFAEDIDTPQENPPVECTYMGVNYTFPRDQSPKEETQESKELPRPVYVRDKETHGWKLRLLISESRGRYQTSQGFEWKYMKEVYDITKDDVITV